jgi:hypothetical protein
VRDCEPLHREGACLGEGFFLRVNTQEAYIDIPTKVDDWDLSHEAGVAAALWLGPPECPITAVPCGPRPDIPVSTEAGLLALPGLVSAHFDIPQLAQTEGDILGRVTTRLNSGIAVVTPAHFVRNLIHNEPVAEELQDRERVSLPRVGTATQDVVSGDG